MIIINLWNNSIKQIKDISDPIKILYTIKDIVPIKYLQEKRTNKNRKISGDIKVILSSYLKKGEED